MPGDEVLLHTRLWEGGPSPWICGATSLYEASWSVTRLRWPSEDIP